MSKSSNTFIGGIYIGAMRYAAPILFWLSLLLLAVTLASYHSVFFRPENDQTDIGTQAFLIFGAIAHALSNAALPFAGAAIVWALNNSRKGPAQ